MKTYSKFIELANRKINDFPTELVKEGLIVSWDYKIFVKKLTDLFTKYNKNLRIDQDHRGVMLVIAKGTFNKKLYEELLSLLKVSGYIISYFYYQYDKGPITRAPNENDIFNFTQDYIYINIIKKFDIENYGGVPEYLYHVTRSIYLSKIEKNGLIPKSQAKIEKHPERIYVTDSLDGAENFKGLLEDMYDVDDFVILEINTKLLKNIKLHYDPTYFESQFDYENSPFKAFYTYDNIPPNAIELL